MALGKEVRKNYSFYTKLWHSSNAQIALILNLFISLLNFLFPLLQSQGSNNEILQMYFRRSMHLPSKLSQDISQRVAKSRLNIKLSKIYDDGSRNVLISAEQTKGVLLGI